MSAPQSDARPVYIAVTPEQIAESDLPTRPTKTSDTRAKNFGNVSVELDALDPNQLRELVQTAIEQRLPVEQYEVLKAAEANERELLTNLIRSHKRAGRGRRGR